MRYTRAMLFAALQPHMEMERRESLDWGERFLDRSSRRELRERWLFQGSNVPLGANVLDFARHRNRTTRLAADLGAVDER